MKGMLSNWLYVQTLSDQWTILVMMNYFSKPKKFPPTKSSFTSLLLTIVTDNSIS